MLPLMNLDFYLPKMKKSRSKSSSPSIFLSLPLEIRLLIYTHLLGDRTIHIGSFTHRHVDKQGRVLCSEMRCREFEVPRHFFIFLTVKNSWCWGHLCHRICNTKTSCIDSTDQEMLIEDESQLYKDEGFKDQDLYAPHYWCTHEPARTALDLRILRTCRQVYEEAKFIPYHTNTFAFHSPRAMARFCMRSLPVTKNPRNKNPAALEEFVPWLKKRFFPQNSSAESRMEEKQVSIPISEIRNLHIHATWRYGIDWSNWDITCFHTAHLWTGLQNLHLSIDVLPEGDEYSDQWMSPKWALGFREYCKSPLRSVSVDVSDKYRHLFCAKSPLGSEKAHYWSTKAQKEEYENGIRDYLLAAFEPGVMSEC